MKTFCINTLGCKVNQYESAALQAMLERSGLHQSGSGKADLVIINSCCITAAAARKSRQAIRKLARQSPEAAVAVVGCLSTYHESQVQKIFKDLGRPAEKILIVGHHDDVADRLLMFLRGQTAAKTPQSAPKTPENIKKRRLDAIKAAPLATQGLAAIKDFPEHQRAFVKIQDGCDAMCSYCVVPFTRSRVWSRGVDEILAECRNLISAGYREIVLCGVFIGAFGRQTAIRRNWPATAATGGSPLAELLYKVSKLDGLWRVRLGSLEPLDVTDELLGLAADNEKIAPHFHMALQSGSAKILRLMNRQYTPDEFLNAVSRLRQRLGDLPAITTDIIVGFPGEDDDDFNQTLAVAKLAGFSKIHAFPFSAIEPTPAWHRRREAPPPEIVRERMERLADVEKTLADEYRCAFMGRTLEALAENSAGPAGYEYRAMTDRYLTVAFNSNSQINAGQLVTLQINGQQDDYLTAEKVSSPAVR
ncbi:MAG TPA: MiaB/RimO family radical SAM methylthiotransferase [Phycisphaerae bacterium]|nr:MiaB/RimO family radical SAM methylthiotransferase [Phycisphaerae bacterium]HPS52116.1 MiaB/RimO family radical SAM methylthiotransferase [Phycisphaerae bacterium]